jgi:hypothetical protein
VSRASAGRGWAYVGAGLGGAVSIAANVAHSYVPPAAAELARLGVTAEEWRPEPGAVIGAVFWPVALFVVVEIVARTAWPAGRRWVALRYAGLLPVAAVAALVSYRHLSGLLTFYGEDGLTAALGPLAVDGLMLTATGALIAAGRPRVPSVLDAEDRSGTAVPTTAEQPPAEGEQPHESTDKEVAPVLPDPDTRDQPEDQQDQDQDHKDQQDQDKDQQDQGGAPDLDPLLPVAREIAAELADAGRPLSRTALTAALRSRGQGVGTSRATALLQQVRAAA